MKEAAGDARNATTWAISTGSLSIPYTGRSFERAIVIPRFLKSKSSNIFQHKKTHIGKNQQ